MKAEYKNAKESKRKIASAYLQLLLDSPKNLTVTNIVKVANINRGTFYLHFNNLQEVAEHIENDLLQKFIPIESMFRQIDIDKFPEVILNKLNEVLLEDLKYYKLLLSVANSSDILDKIKLSIVATISNNFKIMNYISNLDNFKIVVQYVVGGVLSAYTDWLRGQIECPLDTMTTMLSQMIKDCLRGRLR